MKTLMVLPLIAASITGQSRLKTDNFQSISISPFYSGKESTIVIKSRAKNLNVKIYLSNSSYEDKEILDVTITTAGTHVYKYDNRYSMANNEVYLTYTVGGETMYSPEISRNLITSRSRTIGDIESLTSESTVAIFKNNSAWTFQPLTYTFDNFSGYYVPVYYQKINLFDFNIGLEDEYHPFFTADVLLMIKNYNNCFSYISEAEFVSIPLKIKEASNGYTLSLKENLFVNKETLVMSSAQRSGFVETEHIYLPKNEMRNQDKINAYFFFTNFGIDKDTLIYPFEFRALTNIMGDCNNSKYCVVRER